MRIFKAEQWNLELILPLFEQYRLANGMPENPERTFTFLANRIRFSESILFVALDSAESAVGFIQLYPQLSSLNLARYWQISDIYVLPNLQQNEIYQQLIAKAKEFVSFTQTHTLIVENNTENTALWEKQGFSLQSNKRIFALQL